ncbi:TIGR02594 family protein [Acinetobacter sp. Ac_5812]|uniref:TIGR02594 family protein n=1 Tax=Acinetobacter sp. Ac_5812 TaxID=1848937 RepID=UPI00148FBBED|nr:TIGR02594 family protein [Acinetobacter sp. Ac_5812]NNP70385.1 hypothetical protein [Acinetobacter sp. Ac_5812]
MGKLQDPPWLASAKQYLGVQEIVGTNDDPTILGWLKDLDASWQNDEVPWCGVFIAKCLQETGYEYPSSWASALAYAKFGVNLGQPAVGCIAVKKRLEHGKLVGGHVTFIVGRSESGELIGLGGNQSNSVCYKLFNENDFIAFVWPSIYPLKERFNLPTYQCKSMFELSSEGEEA